MSVLSNQGKHTMTKEQQTRLQRRIRVYEPARKWNRYEHKEPTVKLRTVLAEALTLFIIFAILVALMWLSNAYK